MSFIDFISFNPKKSKGSHKNVSSCTIYPQKISCVAKVNKHSEDTIYHFIKDLPIGSITPKFFGRYDDPIYRDSPEATPEDPNPDDEDDDDNGYLILENILEGFKKPNTIDIKLGTRMFDVRTKKASVAKLVEAVEKSTSRDYGFRIDEVHTFKSIKSEYDKNPWPTTKLNKFKKPIQKELENNIVKVNQFFKAFFSPPQLQHFFSELKNIRNVLLMNLHQFPKFRLYASSLFVAYDNDAPEDSEVRIKLIDLAHAHFDIDSDGGNSHSLEFDDGILRGVDSLISIIGLIINEQILHATMNKQKELVKMKKAKSDSLVTRSPRHEVKESSQKAKIDASPRIIKELKTDPATNSHTESTKETKMVSLQEKQKNGPESTKETKTTSIKSTDSNNMKIDKETKIISTNVIDLDTSKSDKAQSIEDLNLISPQFIHYKEKMTDSSEVTKSSKSMNPVHSQEEYIKSTTETKADDSNTSPTKQVTDTSMKEMNTTHERKNDLSNETSVSIEITVELEDNTKIDHRKGDHIPKISKNDDE